MVIAWLRYTFSDPLLTYLYRNDNTPSILQSRKLIRLQKKSIIMLCWASPRTLPTSNSKPLIACEGIHDWLIPRLPSMYTFIVLSMRSNSILNGCLRFLSLHVYWQTIVTQFSTYRMRSLQFHPDKPNGNTAAFQRIADAYQVHNMTIFVFLLLFVVLSWYSCPRTI